MNKSSRIKLNQELIRVLNPDAKIEYPVEYASLDNNAVFAAARIINSLGFDFLNYEDIFKQDFLAAAGYVKHYTTDDEDYEERGRADCSKKPFYRIKDDTVVDTTLEEAAEYNQRMVNELYPVIWSYCSNKLMQYASEYAFVDQRQLQKMHNDAANGYFEWLYSNIINFIKDDIGLRIPTPLISSYNHNIKSSIPKKEIESLAIEQYGIADEVTIDLTIDMLPITTLNPICSAYPILWGWSIYLFKDCIKSICNLFEQLTGSLVRDCCQLINQIKMNTAAGRDINYPVYDTAQGLQQEAINEMAATVEPELFDGLSAEELMASFRKNPYIKDEKEYTDAEMDIVRYIVQDMIDVAKAV